MKRYELDENGVFVCDLLEGQEAANWTTTPFIEGLSNGRLVGATRNGGEWVGGEWAGDSEPSLTREQVEHARLQAYANPLTGSDRYFAEALRRDAIGDTAGAASARLAGVKRYEQIKAQYAWPTAGR